MGASRADNDVYVGKAVSPITYNEMRVGEEPTA